MRCFISIDIDESLANKISEIQEEVKKLDVDVKFVEPENLHFTINFLGNVNENGIGEIRESLNFLRCEHGFKINLAGINYFGGDQIRTLWIGVNEGEERLIKLMKDVNHSVKFGEKNFSPHLTIGRVKSCKNKDELLRFIHQYRKVNIGEMQVKMVKLKTSNLTKNGPIYNDLSVLKLGERLNE